MNKKYPQKNPESEVEFAFMAIKDTFSMIFNLIFWIGVAYIIFFSAVNYPLFDELYGKADIHKEYMEMMVSIFNDSDMKCTQEINPFTGEFSNTAPNFTTSLIMYTEFVKRLGILEK